MHIKTVIFFLLKIPGNSILQRYPQLRISLYHKMEQDSFVKFVPAFPKCSNSKVGKQSHVNSTQAKSQLMPVLSQQLFYFTADGRNAVKLLPFGIDNPVQIKTEQGVDKRDATHTWQL